jgi:cellulose synthase/poly-beta-1,6-N-acetylglucosamine synthase-like glycosyltransferase
METGHIIYQILEYINYIFIALCTVSFLFQIVMIVFCWLPEKHFKPSEDYHRIAIVIAARNEKDVIADSVTSFLTKQNYPKDKFDVYVIADNCTDNTAELAEKAGAHVIVHNDPEPSHHRASYGVAYAFQQFLATNADYDMYIRFDADNRANPDYLRQMNNAFCSGVEVARGFEWATNATQNTWTAVSATYYIRDSRIACNFRERLHLDSMLTGAGMMVSGKIVKEIGGWDAMMISDDAEFAINRLLEKRRIHYVADAIVYEDQASTSKDNWNRLTRMGHGINSLFWRKGFKLFGHFFVSGRWSNVDLFVQVMMIPVDLICCIWFPLYYIAYALLHICNGWLNQGCLLGANIISITGQDFSSTAAVAGSTLPLGVYTSQQAMLSLAFMVIYVLGTYLVLYPLQTWASVMLSKKKLGLKSIKGLKRGIFLSPFFMIYYAVAIAVGVLSKPKWKAVRRNVAKKE